MREIISRLRQLAWSGREYRNWYSIWFDQISEVCLCEGWQVKRAIDLLALLSPRAKVARNVKRWLAYHHNGKLLADIPSGIVASVEHYEATGVIRGQKTSNFAKAIAGDRSAVTLDVHMAHAIGCDQRLFSNSPRQRGLADKLVRSTAILCGLPPRDCQAAIWAGQLLAANQTVAHPDIVAIHDAWVADGRHFER